MALILISCSDNGHLVDPKAYLGQLPPVVGEMDEREKSSALRICLAIRSFRLKSYLRNSPQQLKAHVVQKQCHDIQKLSYMKTVLLDHNNGVLRFRRPGRFLASEVRSIPSDRTGHIGKLCSQLISGREVDRKVEGSQFYFVAKDGEDMIVELRGGKKVNEVFAYKIQTNTLDERFGSVLERQEGQWCGLGKQISFNHEVYLIDRP
ncbi:MAG: hypothetical protein OEY33_00470 [Bdellovibrionales bacterium]|nr:hypothetical protein [Bdellovibrionales bacterium]